MLLTSGGRFGGYGFYLLKGKPVFLWNLVDLKRVRWEGPERAHPRQTQHRIRLQVRRPRRGHAGLQQHERHRPGGTGVLKVDGEEVASHKMERTLPLILQWDETFDIGSDTGTPVDDNDYQVPFKFTGKLNRLTLKLDRPKLSPADQQRLMEAERNNKASE